MSYEKNLNRNDILIIWYLTYNKCVIDSESTYGKIHYPYSASYNKTTKDRETLELNENIIDGNNLI